MPITCNLGHGMITYTHILYCASKLGYIYITNTVGVCVYVYVKTTPQNHTTEPHHITTQQNHTTEPHHITTPHNKQSSHTLSVYLFTL